jgi:hypothetical protein
MTKVGELFRFTCAIAVGALLFSSLIPPMVDVGP